MHGLTALFRNITPPSRQPPHKTVVPAKAGIQEIPRKRACRLSRILDSGFRRNDGCLVLLSAPGRGGFLTRPGSGEEPVGKGIPVFRYSLAVERQCGLQTRPYRPIICVRWEYQYQQMLAIPTLLIPPASCYPLPQQIYPRSRNARFERPSALGLAAGQRS